MITAPPGAPCAVIDAGPRAGVGHDACGLKAHRMGHLFDVLREKPEEASLLG